MASLMEDLLDTLEQETKGYGELLTYTEEKKKAVISSDLPALQQVTDKEQEATDHLKSLEVKRMKLLKSMGEVMGKDRILTVTETIALLSSQPAEQKKLTEARDALREVATKVQTANTRNEALIRQALEMVEFDLTLLRGLRAAPETANYDRNAANTGALLGHSGFDAKQ